MRFSTLAKYFLSTDCSAETEIKICVLDLIDIGYPIAYTLLYIRIVAIKIHIRFNVNVTRLHRDK